MIAEKKQNGLAHEINAFAGKLQHIRARQICAHTNDIDLTHESSRSEIGHDVYDTHNLLVRD